MPKNVTYPPDLNGINALIQRFGPTVLLHSKEQYLIDDPGLLFNSEKLKLDYGIIKNEDDYNNFSEQLLGSLPISSQGDLPTQIEKAKACSQAQDPAFRYWLNIPDELKGGNMERARSQVAVYHRDYHLDNKVQPDAGLVQLQFWFFYAFNGPGKFSVSLGNVYSDDVQLNTVGSHYGDWEHVTIELRYHNNDWSIGRIYLSRHDLDTWVDPKDVKFKGEHPIIYIAKDSHAHYTDSGKHNYKRVAHKDYVIAHLDVDLYDLTDEGHLFDTALPGNSFIFFSDFPDHMVQQPAWASFSGRWGQYEKLSYTYNIPALNIGVYNFTEIGSGPRGPLQHNKEIGPYLSKGAGVTVVDGGRPYAYLLDNNGQLLLNGWWNERFNWYYLGTPGVNVNADRAAGVITVDGGRPYSYVLGSNGHLWHNGWLNDQYKWVDLGAPTVITALLGATTVDGSRPYAYVLSSEGELWCNGWYDNQFKWDCLGKPANSLRLDESIFQAITVDQHRPYVYVLSIDGHLWHNGWHDNQFNWVDLGAPVHIEAILGTTVVDGSRPYAYVLGADGNLWCNSWNNNQFNWVNLGKPVESVQFKETPVGAITVDRGRPYVYLIDSDDNLWYNGWYDEKFNWVKLGSPPYSVRLAGAVGSVTVDGSRPYAYMIGSDGRLWSNWWNGASFIWSDLSN